MSVKDSIKQSSASFLRCSGATTANPSEKAQTGAPATTPKLHKDERDLAATANYGYTFALRIGERKNLLAEKN
jgi:hypothetical protein